MAEKMCTAEAALLNSGMSKKVVCVDYIVCPFGNLTVNGLLFTFLFKHVTFDNKKCPVQPESKRAVSLFFRMGGVKQSSNVSLLSLEVSPKTHSLLTWYPPMLFVLVASRWCVSLVYMQVWLVWVRATL
jgi:hypothetical protein